MPRQPGLGRGLAAILPGAFGDEDPDAASGGQGIRSMPLLTSELAAGLGSADSGIGLIYKTLDALVEQHDLEDAAIVVEEMGLGRQVFRAGRRPLNPADEALLIAPPGLYTQPRIEDLEFDRSLIFTLCVIALRLDVLRYDAWHDPLTGLYDRRSFDRLLEMAVARSTRYGWPFTLVILDLDDLKAINDREGHQAGDAALRELGERFRQALRFGDNAARIGGDEFAMILPNTEPDLVPALLERVQAAPGNGGACPSFSFGCAQCPADGDDVEGLIAVSDERLYAAKEGRG